MQVLVGVWVRQWQWRGRSQSFYAGPPSGSDRGGSRFILTIFNYSNRKQTERIKTNITKLCSCGWGWGSGGCEGTFEAWCAAQGTVYFQEKSPSFSPLAGTPPHLLMALLLTVSGVSRCSVSRPSLFSIFHTPFQERVIFMRLLAYFSSAVVIRELLCLWLAAFRSGPHSAQPQNSFTFNTVSIFFLNENYWVHSCPVLLKTQFCSESKFL